MALHTHFAKRSNNPLRNERHISANPGIIWDDQTLEDSVLGVNVTGDHDFSEEFLVQGH